ncbi:125_t:CDS:2, partial [Acaulospora colombiana]
RLGNCKDQKQENIERESGLEGKVVDVPSESLLDGSPPQRVLQPQILPSNDHRVLISKNDGTILYDLFHIEGPPNSKWNKIIYRIFCDEIHLMEYDMASEQLFIGFADSISLCHLHDTSIPTGKSDRFLQCGYRVAGAGFLMSGSRCIVTLPEARL